jgi:hypothetical protein
MTSRANSLKHGLAGEGVVLTPDDAQAVAQRMVEWRDEYRPVGPQQEWLFEQVVVCSVQIDHCQHLQSALRSALARRAAVCWDEDRQLAAEETAVGLGKRPSLVTQRLRQTPQGCDWMLRRWAWLGGVLEENGTWSEPQAALAWDLLGIDPVLRSIPLVGPDETGAELVAEQTAALEAYKAEVLEELDEFDRSAAEVGLPVGQNRALERLLRYEAACFRRLQWASARLRRPSRTPVPAEDVTIAPAPPPAPAPAPSPEPPFRFELEPDLTPEPTEQETLALFDGLMMTAARHCRVSAGAAVRAKLGPPPSEPHRRADRR